jgi:hypothetical protein
MPLFNESLESIAQAIVTVKRALKAGVIEKGEYKGLSDYLAKRAKDFKIKKTHLVQANKDLDEELVDEELEFFMEEGDALYKMAEELLEEFDEKPAAEVELTADEKVDCDGDAWLDEVKAVVKAEQKAQKAWAAWMKMDDKELTADEKVDCDAWLDEVKAVVKAEQKAQKA